MNIRVNYQNSILIDERIYVDPLKVDGGVPAQFIFITHPHWDHFSVEDIKKIVTKETIIVCPKTMKGEVEKHFDNASLYVEPSKNYKLGDMEFETFASYNTSKPFHPKENQWVGYQFNIDGQTVAVVGDSDSTPELEKLKTDILLIPIGGHYTMTFEEGARLTNIICPKRVIPTHYGDIVGDQTMGEKFKALINSNIDCQLQL